MERAVIKILDVFHIQGRTVPLVVFEFLRGSTSDLLGSTFFAAPNSGGMWRLTSLAHVDPPRQTREAAGFEKIAGNSELQSGMELVQTEGGQIHDDGILSARAKIA